MQQTTHRGRSRVGLVRERSVQVRARQSGEGWFGRTLCTRVDICTASTAVWAAGPLCGRSAYGTVFDSMRLAVCQSRVHKCPRPSFKQGSATVTRERSSMTATTNMSRLRISLCHQLKEQYKRVVRPTGLDSCSSLMHYVEYTNGVAHRYCLKMLCVCHMPTTASNVVGTAAVRAAHTRHCLVNPCERGSSQLTTDPPATVCKIKTSRLQQRVNHIATLAVLCCCWPGSRHMPLLRRERQQRDKTETTAVGHHLRELECGDLPTMHLSDELIKEVMKCHAMHTHRCAGVSRMSIAALWVVVATVLHCRHKHNPRSLGGGGISRGPAGEKYLPHSFIHCDGTP